jgi:hypothetical protein
MNKRILITTVTIAALGFAFYASGTGRQTFAQRYDNAVTDLSKAQAPIPYLKLHERALEILRERPMPPVVAKDEPTPLPRPRPTNAP